MNIVRAGTNSKITVTATPTKIAEGNPIKGGLVIQNTDETAGNIYVYQGNANPPTSAAGEGFILQQYAMLNFSDAAQQNPIWVWSSGGSVSATVNQAG